jgi:hypothetical protein
MNFMTSINSYSVFWIASVCIAVSSTAFMNRVISVA